MKAVKDTSSQPEKTSWSTPTLRPVGTIGEVLQGGGGKLSIVADDPGDANKPKGSE